MSEFTYTYSISLDFPSGLNVNQFTIEVELSSLGPIFLRVDVVGDDCNVIFSQALTAPQVVILDGLVAAHTPLPRNVIIVAEGFLQISSTLTHAQAVQIEATDPAGGVVLTSGNGGVNMETTGVCSMNAASGINMGNNADAAFINMGTGNAAKIISVGNTVGNTTIFEKWGTGGHITTQSAPTVLPDGDSVLSINQLLNDLIMISPTANRNLTLPTAANAVAGMSGVSVNDCVTFHIMHLTTGVSDPVVNILMGLGGGPIGNMVIAPSTNNAGTYNYSGVGGFMLRFTNISGGTESYTVYRIS